jgi:hypothetical protein
VTETCRRFTATVVQKIHVFSYALVDFFLIVIPAYVFVCRE